MQTLGSFVWMPAMDLTTFQDDDKELRTDRYVIFILCVCACARARVCVYALQAITVRVSVLCIFSFLY